MNINKKEFEYNGKTMISNTKDAVIEFGGVEWYVIGVNEDGTELTLFKKDIVRMSEFDNDSNSYYNSKIRKILRDIGKKYYWDMISERIQTTDGVIEDDLFLLSYDEICFVDEEIRKCFNDYWLRTPDADYFEYAWVVYTDGSTDTWDIACDYGVRPACVIEVK